MAASPALRPGELIGAGARPAGERDRDTDSRTSTEKEPEIGAGAGTLAGKGAERENLRGTLPLAVAGTGTSTKSEPEVDSEIDDKGTIDSEGPLLVLAISKYMVRPARAPAAAAAAA